MTLSKKAIAKLATVPPDLLDEAISLENRIQRVKGRKTQISNYIARIKAQRNIRDQARAMGVTDIARKAQVEIRYLSRKLAALRARS